MDEWIIADSGGTKTDWCRVNTKGIVERLQTESYHPVYFRADSSQSMKSFWETHATWLNLPLYFFGSGCYREEPRQLVLDLLRQVGFRKVHVQSDVHAAALAVLGEQAGWVAILGTGSVLIEWNGSDVQSLIGGKGHLEGDEGSGYYFGRLLMDHYEKNTLDEDGRKLLTDFLKTHPGFSSASNDKAELASLAARFGSHSEFSSIHSENIAGFLRNYAQDLPAGTTLHFVGSYAEAQSAVLKLLLPEFDLITGEIVGRPIERLIEQSQHFID